MRYAPLAVALGLPLAAAAPALSQHDVIFTTVPGAATSQVPGMAGVEFTAFRRPTRSPDGLKWMMPADTTVGYVVLVDRGDGMGPQVVLQEGQHAPWAAAGSGETVGAFTLTDRNVMILDDGRFVFTNNTSGGDSGADEYVVVFDGVNFVAVAQEGQPVPASAGLPAGTLYGSALECPQIDAAGRIGFDATLSGVATTEDNALFFDGQIVAREGVMSPTGQLGGLMETYRDFSNRGYYRSADGARWLSYARINGNLDQDRMAVVNGAVVAQEGVLLPGFAAPVGSPGVPFQGITEVAMMTGGDWFVRGANTDGMCWTMRNGEVIATMYEPITPGAAEHWDPFLFTPTFITAVGNDTGDYVVCGTTDTFPVDFGGVIVLNGEHIVVRSFDPIDLNGNGLDDDHFFINAFFFDDVFLTDAGRLVVKVQTRDEFGTTMGEAILDVDVSALIGAGCACELDDDAAQVDVFDLLAYLDLWFASDAAADIDGAAGVDVFDLLAFLDCWFPANAGSPCP